MATLTLGRTPEPLVVRMVRGGAFRAVLRAQDRDGVSTPWPLDSALRLRLESGSFELDVPWVIDGELASVEIPATTVDTLPTVGTVRAQLWLNYGEGEFLWSSGTVIFNA